MSATLDYLDQASFLGLRALGHGPVDLLAWVYRRPVDLAQLHRFRDRLSRGLLGRLVEPSPLPFGRHRWVRAHAPEVEVAARPADDAITYLDSLVDLPVDPEHGPGWRLLVQPLRDGGTVVALLASHTIADGLGLATAVTHAVEGTGADLVYPPPGARTRLEGLREDAAESLRSLPDTARALVAAARLARQQPRPAPAGDRAVAPTVAAPVTIPSVHLLVPEDEWDRRAAALHGSGTALAAALAAAVGQRAGRLGGDGRVRIAMPVSLRGPGDTRGNALTGITVDVEPASAVLDLAPVRSALRDALATVRQEGNSLLAPQALVPYLPRRLARHIEGLVLGDASTVGCSHVGALDPAVGRPDGTAADVIVARLLEPMTAARLARNGGTLTLTSLSVDGRVSLSVAGWQRGRVESREELADCALGAVEALRLPHTVV